jgi:hypothetical protein
MKQKRLAILISLCIISLQSITQEKWQWIHSGGNGKFYSQSIIQSIDIDEKQNVFATGIIADSTIIDSVKLKNYGNSDIILIKYNKLGKLIWVKSFGSKLMDIGKSIKVGKDGSIFISGFIGDTAFFDNLRIDIDRASTFLARLDSNGNVKWVKTGDINGHTTSWIDPSLSLAIDNNSNIYMSGYCNDNSVVYGANFKSKKQSSAIYISKLDENGTEKWTKFIEGSSQGFAEGNLGVDLLIDKANNIIYTASITRDDKVSKANAISMYNNLLLGKVDSQGNFLWQKEFGDTLIEKWHGMPKSITLDENQSIYLTGIYYKRFFLDTSKIANNSGGFICKLNSSNGNLIFANPYNSNNSSIVSFMSCDYNYDGNVSYCGKFCGEVNFGGIVLKPISTNYDCDNFISNFDTTGKLNWALRFGYYNYDNLFTSAAKKNIYAVGGSFKDSLKLDSHTVYTKNNVSNSEFFFLATKLNVNADSSKSQIMIPNSESFINFYPIPSKSFIYIESNFDLSLCEYSIYTVDLKLVKSADRLDSSQIDVSNLNSGYYYIRLKNKEMELIKKILVN